MGCLHLSSTFLSFLFLISLLSEVNPASFKIVNRCRHTIWPGFLSGANTPQLPTTGFVLNPGKSRTVTIPRSWSGRLWGRALCGQDSSGKFVCLSGDCGSGQIECSGSGAKPPATLAEFTLNGDGGLDFYDVSLVDGYNLPMLVVAKGGKGGNCSATGCLLDLNGACPPQLRGDGGVGCRSACEAFGDPQYCCSGAFGTPDVCHPSVFSLFFKHACPRAYSYAYDDVTSTYTCAGADYVIIFCPPPYSRLLTAIGVSRLPQEVFCISPALKGFNFYCQSNTCKFSKALNFKYVQLECSNKLKAFVFHSIHTNHSHFQRMF
ncbi:hypothetical protein E1A91_D12G035900v1 [Gossypium mustelinum]|uniref:Thaumatin-like protein 1b n=3 Tax=Gossypium TaxID=3633 RepID=A0A5D2SCI5_GOSMU|nr:hypothetical protein ES332_D12G037200v1 [Gossypium tomentosum]TYI49454.1 hypothetical protein E1A91_D12G035900v1 [Gossypium mustelinum]